MPKRVGKAIARFPKKDREFVLATLREFAIDPWRGDIVKIKGEENLLRRRVGNYRIFYSAAIETRVVEIKEVERRTSTTYS